MLFAFDVGNTNITIGGYNGNDLAFTTRIASDTRLTADSYAVAVEGVLRLRGATIGENDDCIVCSVVPSITRALTKALRLLCKKEPLVLGPGVKTGLNIKIDNPAQLGADLAAGAVGAMASYKLPCVVIDLGTATTLTVINSKGEFLGGAIAAGVKSTLDALTENTAQLNPVAIEVPKKIIASNTAECMKSGLIVGAAAMIDGLVDRMEEELGEKFASVIATGGLSEAVVSCCKREIIIDKNLLLDGLKIIFHKNK